MAGSTRIHNVRAIHGFLRPFLHSPSSYLKRRRLTTNAMNNCSIKFEGFNFLSLFKRCQSKEDLKRLKSLLIVHGLTEHEFLLGQFFKSCFHLGVPDIALFLFKSIKKPCVFLQNFMIRNLCDSGLYEDLLCVYLKCRDSGCPSDGFTFPSVIKACSLLGDFRIGRVIHCVVFRTGFEKNVVIQTALVGFYAKNGEMGSARKLIDRIPHPDLVSWNALIAGYSLNGLDQEAFEAFEQLRSKGLKPSVSTFASVIPVCTRLGRFRFGKSLHGFIVKSGYLSDAFLVPALISMYAGDCDLSACRKLFDSVLEKNATVWNAMISAYTHGKKSFEAFELLRRMLRAETKPDLITFVSIIPSCEDYSSIPYGESLHACVTKHGLGTQLSILTALLSMYAKLGDVEAAKFLFDQIPNRNLLAWNAMISGMATRNTVSCNTLISGCVQNGEVEKAVVLFHQMRKEGAEQPDMVTLISVIPSYNQNEDLQQGQAIHVYAIKSGYGSDVSLVNSLITMYCKCGNLEDGRLLFEVMQERSLVSWNALITGYRYHDLQNEVLVLFGHMRKEGQKPNHVTLLNLLPVCYTSVQGKSIHAFAVRTGIVHETSLVTSLMFMYARFGSINLCILLFQMEKKRMDISLWNAIISVLVQTKNVEQALASFCELLRMGLEPDHITVLSLISACVQVNNLNLTNSVMAWLIQKGFYKDVAVSNALIDLYARCGSISIAKKLFESLLVKDVVSWGVMINGFGLHGDGEAALDLFVQMQLSGVRPDDITYLSVLSACSHAGLVEQSRRVFKSMVEDGISPRMEHYACMVDLLGRAGLLDEAFNYVKRLPCKPSRSLLESLSGACRIHGNVELGEKISEMVLEMDPENPGSYVMLHNIYASAGRWEDANRVRSDMKRRGLKKVPGFSLVGVGHHHEHLS
ncbi:hypothetical protein Q3G72_024232 [Acer saccharum]|nr:hypothetical protein Q3G72_024232 [Acer saccharum]